MPRGADTGKGRLPGHRGIGSGQAAPGGEASHGIEGRIEPGLVDSFTGMSE